MGATLRNANPELEEAARVHGAGVWDTIRRVTMRLSLPSIMALSMLVFIRAIEAFEVPALVGLPGRISVLTTDIYSNMVARAPPDIGGASALSVLMLGLVLWTSEKTNLGQLTLEPHQWRDILRLAAPAS